MDDCYFILILANSKKRFVTPLTHKPVDYIVGLDDRTDLSLQQLLLFRFHCRKSALGKTLVHFFVDLFCHAGHGIGQLAATRSKRFCSK